MKKQAGAELFQKFKRLNGRTIDEIINSHRLVIFFIDYEIITRNTYIVLKIADNNKDKLSVFFINVEKEISKIKNLKIENIPMLAFFKNGTLFDTIANKFDEYECYNVVKRFINKKI